MAELEWEGEAHEALDHSCMAPTVQVSGCTVMIRGYFTWSGFGSVTLYSNKLKSQDYFNILDSVTMDWCNSIFIFLMDPVFFKMAMLLSTGLWLVPGPREIIFSYGMLSTISWFKPYQKLVGPTSLPSSVEELSQRLLVVLRTFATFFRSLDQYSLGYLQNIVESMSNRMKAVKNVKFSPINY